MQLKKYELTEDDFERFRRLISQASGIYFDRGKWDLLKLGLSERAEARGVESLRDYYRLVTEDAEGEVELRELLSNLSVQETQFFRNLPQFNALRQVVLPEIIKRKAIGGHRSLRLWSAGCSTGQEPYSIAMSVLDVLPDHADWNIQVMGTDLNQSALDMARRGWYPEKKLTGIDREHRRRYFRESEGGFEVADPVKRLVHFSRHNMVTDQLPIDVFGTCDIIFCRNVIIYFTHETAKYVIELFYDILNPGGYLFLGHSETLWKMSAKYSLVELGDAFIYKKALPRSIEGRRFMPDRRMQQLGLPPDIMVDRRRGDDRRQIFEAEPAAVVQTVPVEEQVEAGEELLLKDARSFLELGEYDRAVETLERTVKDHATCAEAHYLMGLALEKGNRLEEAAESFRKTIYCDESHSLATFHLASVLERLGKLKAAVREYRNAAAGLRQDEPGRWERELDSYEVSSLVDLCEWKIENLGSLE